MNWSCSVVDDLAILMNGSETVATEPGLEPVDGIAVQAVGTEEHEQLGRGIDEVQVDIEEPEPCIEEQEVGTEELGLDTEELGLGTEELEPDTAVVVGHDHHQPQVGL